MMVIRSLLFNAVFYINLVGWLVVCLPLIVLPRPRVTMLLRNWAKSSIWLLRVVGGVSLEVRGGDHCRSEPLLVASKHQSLFETFALLPFFADPAFILKRELHWIPLFGWWSMKFRMIPVHRGKGSEALKLMTTIARQEARSGRQIIIFPEGTRTTPGAPPQYKFGVAFLYERCDVPCLPVALNSGLFWPRRKWQRYPGTIVIEFLEPIPPGLPRTEFLQRLEQRIENASDRLLQDAAGAAYAPPLPEAARRKVAELDEAAIVPR